MVDHMPTNSSASKKEAIPLINKERTALRLKALMLCRCLRPADIQKYLGLSCVQTVYRWLEGVNIPSVDHLYAICGLLQTSIDDLLVGTGVPVPTDRYTRQKLRLTFFYLKMHQGVCPPGSYQLNYLK